MLVLLSLLACSPRGLAPDEPVPDFELVDQNLSSELWGQTVSPSDYEGQVSAWYFGSASCPYCVDQLTHLWELEVELRDEAAAEVTILGINPAGFEQWNGTAIEGHDLPWLQDREDEDVWGVWDVRYRDVVILNGQLHPVSTHNLTSNDLAESDNVEALRALIEEAAD